MSLKCLLSHAVDLQLFISPFCITFLNKTLPLGSSSLGACIRTGHGSLCWLAGEPYWPSYSSASPSLHPKHSWGDHSSPAPQQHFLNSKRLFLAHLNKGHPHLTQCPQARRHANQRTPQSFIHRFTFSLQTPEPLKSTVLPGSTL